MRAAGKGFHSETTRKRTMPQGNRSGGSTSRRVANRIFGSGATRNRALSPVPIRRWKRPLNIEVVGEDLDACETVASGTADELLDPAFDEAPCEFLERLRNRQELMMSLCSIADGQDHET